MLTLPRMETVLHEPAPSPARWFDRGHGAAPVCSPDGFGYDHDRHEGVLLLEGEAEIAFAEGQRVHLIRGDTLNLPAHTRHRVTFTSRPAVWLAVLYR